MVDDMIQIGFSMERAIKDNKLPFTHKDKNYRIISPTGLELSKAREASRKKRLELMNDPNNRFREVLIKEITAKGIDLDAIDAEIKELEVKFFEIQKNALIALKEKRLEDVAKAQETYKNEIEPKQQELAFKKYELLSYSIEDQQDLFYKMNLVVLCTQVEKEPGQWVALFNTVKDYEECADLRFKEWISCSCGYMFTRDTEEEVVEK
jgi:hypothetical protein